MTKLLPRSLFGQTLLILLIGLGVSHLVGAWIYAGDREQAVRAIGALAAAERIANLARLVDEAPAEWRPRIVAALNDPTLGVSLSPAAPTYRVAQTVMRDANAIADYLAGQLNLPLGRELRVALSEAPNATTSMMPARRMMNMPMMSMMYGVESWRDLKVAIHLADKQWLLVATRVPDTGPSMSWRFFASMVAMALIVLTVSVWAVRRVTAPLGQLARAANRLGKDVSAEPLPERGSTEMRQAAGAFNRMQERLRRLVENRTQMLAAISHDLRTPLTLLRLRSEGAAESDDRDRMLATISDMDRMIEATLAYAREEAKLEPRRQLDLTALLASIVDDMVDAGLPVEMEPASAVIYECQPIAMKRALTNLLDNAVKYGKQARAAIRSDTSAVEITIDDEGPGIPEVELERVFQPFYRVEGSRSRETGGMGLGLAIALSAVQTHGGELILANRPNGGLRARVRLPR